MTGELNREAIAEWFKHLQDDICHDLEKADGKAVFQEELWEREGGGGGRTRIMQEGNVIEKGGVNFSAVHGHLPENIQTALKLDKSNFFASGVSIVMHPSNPCVPIIHMNVRYFEIDENTWWFGGGIDLTPHYVIPEDAAYFHSVLKEVCDHHSFEYYPKYKKWADDYFYIKHRNETRGVGGIFFDRLTAKAEEKADLFAFVKALGRAFSPIYLHFIHKYANAPFSDAHKEWQYIRRSRYVEYNLVYDKGTRFGLDTDGRTESILMSMPPLAKWPYNYKPEAGSEEEKTVSFLKKNIDWLSFSSEHQNPVIS